MAALLNNEPDDHYDFIIESLTKVCLIFYLIDLVIFYLDETREITTSMGYFYSNA